MGRHAVIRHSKCGIVAEDLANIIQLEANNPNDLALDWSSKRQGLEQEEEESIILVYFFEFAE